MNTHPAKQTKNRGTLAESNVQVSERLDHKAVDCGRSLAYLQMELAALLTSFVTPFLPHLLKLGKPVAESAGKKLGEKFGEDSWEKAKQVWGALSPKVKEKPLAQGAAAAIAEDTQDQDAQTILTQQLKKLLAANPDLASSLQQMMTENADTVAKVTQITQTVTGDQNIVIGDASGSINITRG